MHTLKIWQRASWLSGFLFFLTLSGLAQTTNTVGPQTFEKIKVLMLKDGKTREIPARLRFTGTEVVIEDANGKVLLTATNEAVKAAEYSYSKHRRWQPLAVSGIAFFTFIPFWIAIDSSVAIGVLEWVPVAGFFSLPVTGVLALTHSKKHWLTLRAGKEVVMLRLDKRHYRSVVTALENQTKLTVAWQGER